MKTIETIYKGVPLTGNRTEQMIDTIIEKRDSMSTIELTELVGLDSFRSLVGIFRQLNKANGTATPKAKAPKKSKTPSFVVKEAKNTFTNYCGTGKDFARNLIAEAILETKRQGSNILTLPAAKWIMEKKILKENPNYKFTAVERDKETYLNMLKNLVADSEISDSVINTHNCTIGEVIADKKADTFSSLILDYCGHVDSFFDEINDVMKRNLVKKGGFITITLGENDRLLNHPNHTTNYSNTFIQKCFVEGEEYNGARITNDLINFLVFSNSGYKIVKKFPYRDKVVNMQLFIIKRIEE